MKNLALKLKGLTLSDVLFIGIAIIAAVVVVLTVKEAIHIINVNHINFNRLIN